MRTNSMNRILLLTLLAIVVIAAYVVMNSYYSLLKSSEEKELFKLDCIANAVAFKISGDEHNGLIEKYPLPKFENQAVEDSSFKKIRMMLEGTKMMTKVPSEMFTVVKDSITNKYFEAISSDNVDWMVAMDPSMNMPDSIYMKGGVIGRYESADGLRLGAMSPLMDGNNNVVGVLRVEETFDSFFEKARDQIFFNIYLSLLFVAIVGILMFFSVRSILQRQQKLALEKVEVENMRRELLANVSHDLRTPIAGIHGYLETLLMKKNEIDAATTEKYLNTALQSTHQLKNLVDELFELSKLESRERTLKAEPFSLSELIQDTCATFKGSLAAKNITLLMEVVENLPMVNGEIGLIDRVLQNLISNAIKFTPSGGSITVRAHEVSGKIEVIVSDTGEGISPEDLPRVFDRFHKGKTSKSGTGLGLAIVKSALNLHHSEPMVKSEFGKGSSFSFRL